MTRHDDPHSGSPQDARLRDAVRNLPAPRPEPAYRARVKEEFLAQDPAPRAGHGRGRRAWTWVGVAAAAAAVAVAVRLLSWGPEWRVTGAGAEIRVDGALRPVPAAGPASLPRGGVLHNAGTAPLRLELPQAVVCDLAPGSSVRLDDGEGRGQRLELVEGTLMGTTGPSFPRAGLWVELRGVEAHIQGTTFSLMTGPDSTCVCVLEGSVAARLDDAIDLNVDPGFRFTVYGDGRPARRDALLPEELAMMERQRDASRTAP